MSQKYLNEIFTILDEYIEIKESFCIDHNSPYEILLINIKKELISYYKDSITQKNLVIQPNNYFISQYESFMHTTEQMKNYNPYTFTPLQMDINGAKAEGFLTFKMILPAILELNELNITCEQ